MLRDKSVKAPCRVERLVAKVSAQAAKAAKFDALLLAAKMARSDLELPFSHSHDADVRHAYMALSAGIEKAEKP